MKRKILIFPGFFLFFVGSFSACKETINTDNLVGKWINEHKDTLAFVNNSMLEYKPNVTNINQVLYVYDYRISKDSITLWLMYSSNTNDIKKYYFKYSNKQIEIRNFQNIEFYLYKRLK
jgi:hypothetical protein